MPRQQGVLPVAVTTKQCRICFFIVQDTRGDAGPFFGLFGYFLSGRFGMNVIIEYLIISKPL